MITPLDSGNTQNLLATHGSGSPFFLFAGHTDVVPPGPLEQWSTDPFTPVEKNGFLYGRGAADMKSGVATMVLALLEFVKKNPNHQGTIGLVITSDEEGPATEGTIKVVEFLKKQHKIPDYVLVGEASSDKTLGDAIKIGRRGSLHGTITFHGKQGHIAYPENALNPIHHAFKALDEIAKTKWDKATTHFPSSTLQFHTVHSSASASNVTPAELVAKFNLRFSPDLDPNSVKKAVTKHLETANLPFTLEYNVSSHPYFSGECELATLTKDAIKKICNLDTQYNTKGGTSDGRHFATLGSQVIELGPVNESIHQINEHVKIEDLDKLSNIYEQILTKIYPS